MGDTYKKNQGTAGLEGVQFQLDVLSVCLLNALHHHKDWKISTEDPEAGKYDDIVIKLFDESAVLIQTKHKEKSKITKDQLLSYNSKNADFSLPKYFFSYEEIKRKFKTKTVIICTNTDINPKGLENMITSQPANSNSLLHYEGDSCSFSTFNDNILPDLKASSEIFFDKNLQKKNIDKAVITDENMKEFLKNLQFFSSYPDRDNLHKIIEQLLSRLNYSRICGKTSYYDFYRKIEGWFKQKKGEYLTEALAKALLCEIRSDQYCESLKNYQMSFDPIDFHFKDSNQIFDVKSEEGYLLQMLKIYQALQENKSKKLYVNPDDSVELQNCIIEAFELHHYEFLIMVWSKIRDETVMKEISSKLTKALEKHKYKKVILVTQRSNALVQDMGFTNIFQIDGSITFGNLSKKSQEKLLRKENIVFQGIKVNLEKLLGLQKIGEYSKSLDSTTLERLVRGEEVRVGVQPLDIDEDTAPYYVSRTFEKDIDETQKKEGTISEDRIFYVKEKTVIISDTAGMGKTTILTKLAATVNKKHWNLWVIRINCNDYTAFFRDCLKKNKETIRATELLNSKEVTKITNQLEELVFSMKEKVVLMVDGVDEISPDYTSLILSLLTQCHKAPNLAKVFVTTRPNVASKLKAVLKVRLFNMFQFTERDQIHFLSKYWIRNLELSDSKKDKCKRYAETLISKMRSWVKDYYGTNPFAAVPLQARMLSEIFQQKVPFQSVRSLNWEACKEFINRDGDEPKLPEEFDIVKLYDMFIEKKRGFFIEKGNPSGNLVANKALVDKFEECLAYHCSLALEEILDETKVNLFSRVSLSEEDTEYMVKVGIVQKSTDRLQFIHRTFAEYFVAKSILRELQQLNSNVEFHNFLIDEILENDEFKVIRAFLDNFLQEVVTSLPYNIFECYQSYGTKTKRNRNLIFLLSDEGCLATLRLILKGIHFKTVEGKIIDVDDWKAGERIKNTLEELHLLVREAGVNIRDTDGCTPLHIAAQGGHFELVKFLIDQGADIDIRNKMDRTVLHFSAKSGQLDIVKYLVELGVDINVKCNDGCTALHLAAKNGQLHIVKYFIELGIDKYVKSDDGLTILHLAAQSGQSDIVKYLLVQLNLDSNIRSNDGRTPLHFAAESNQLDIVKYLLEKGKYYRSNDGSTVLHYAAKSGHLDSVKYLVEKGINTYVRNNDRRTVLHSAAENGALNTVKYLVAFGMDPNDKCDGDRTVLHLAAESGKLDIVKYLLELDVDINIRNNHGCTAFCVAAAWGHLDIVKYIVETNIDINGTRNNGCKALLSAVQGGHWDIVKYLVELGMDIEVTSDENRMFLHSAAESGKLDVIRFIESKKLNTDINITSKDGRTALHVAAISGTLNTVKYLVEKGININIRCKDGCTALHYATKMGQLDIVKYLIEKGIDINIRSNNNSTALHYATKRCQLGIVKYLVELDIDINVSSNQGSMLLHYAAECGQLDIVKYLVELNIDINVKSTGGRTALHSAAQWSHWDIVKCLIKKGIDINIKSDNGYTALHYATKKSLLDIVKYLIELDIDIDIASDQSRLALHFAAECGELDIVKYLVELNIDINVRSNDGRTALHFAVAWGHLDIVKYLVQKDIDINTKSDNGYTVLHYAANRGQLDIVKYLVGLDIDINATSNDGSTVLHSATESGHLDIVKYLVGLDIDINATSNDGSTVLHLATGVGRLDIVIYFVKLDIDIINVTNIDGNAAMHVSAERGHLDIVKYLEGLGIDINVRSNDGSTPLHYAAKNGQMDIVKHFVELGIDINVTNNDGSTALHSAAEGGELDIVKYIIELGIDKNVKSNDGCTALHFAAKNGQLETVQYLVRKGIDIRVKNNNDYTALNFATKNRHLDVVKYLREVDGKQ